MQKANWQIDWTVLHTLVQPSLDAWLITFSAVMILQHQNHCLLNLGGVQIGACFIRAQLREYLYQVDLWSPKPLPGQSELDTTSLSVAYGEL